MKFIHLTDLHIMPNSTDPALFQTDSRTTLAIGSINAAHGDAALCIVTGDIVANPDRQAYLRAEALLSTLDMPVYCLPGNHDEREMARELLSSVQSDQHGFLQQAVDTPAGRFLLLDTTDEGSNAGTLCNTRLAWIEEQLNASDGPVWIFMHHAPFATGLAAMDQIGLDRPSADALGVLLEAHGRVAHLFFGHYHRPMSGVWRGIPFSSHRSMMLQCALDLVVEDHVPAIREEPQYAVVLTDDDRTVVHYHDFAAQADLSSLGSPTG